MDRDRLYVVCFALAMLSIVMISGTARSENSSDWIETRAIIGPHDEMVAFKVNLPYAYDFLDFSVSIINGTGPMKVRVLDAYGTGCFEQSGNPVVGTVAGEANLDDTYKFKVENMGGDEIEVLIKYKLSHTSRSPGLGAFSALTAIALIAIMVIWINHSKR